MTASKRKVFLEIFFLFILPVLLIYLNIIPKEVRLGVLALVFFILIGIVVKEKWSFKSLGIRLDNIQSGLLPYTLFTIFSVGVVFLIARLAHSGTVENWWKDMHFQFLFLPISFIQEFAYRGFLIPRLKGVIASPWLVIVINAAIFAFLHIFYPNAVVNLALTFFGGIGFAALYYRYPNLFLATISHCILNFVTVYFCFVGFAHCRPM